MSERKPILFDHVKGEVRELYWHELWFLGPHPDTPAFDGLLDHAESSGFAFEGGVSSLDSDKTSAGRGVTRHDQQVSTANSLATPERSDSTGPIRRQERGGESGVRADWPKIAFLTTVACFVLMAVTLAVLDVVQ